MYMENIGDQTKLSIVKGYLGELNVAAPGGDEFIIKLDNDEILKLTTSVASMPNSYVSQGVVLPITHLRPCSIRQQLKSWLLMYRCLFAYLI